MCVTNVDTNSPMDQFVLLINSKVKGTAFVSYSFTESLWNLFFFPCTEAKLLQFTVTGREIRATGEQVDNLECTESSHQDQNANVLFPHKLNGN